MPLTFTNTDSNKMPHKIKLSEIKANIAQVINNLQQLESKQIRLNSKQTDALQRDTTNLLESLEGALPLAETQVKARAEQRKRKRFRQHRDKTKNLQDVAVANISCKELACSQQLPTADQKLIKTREVLFSQKRCKDAINMLEKFQLLERLCEVRGGDTAKLSQKLQPMRQVWQRVLQENTKETSKSLESQWHTVLFGQDSHLDESGRVTKRKYVEKRAIWDSYISQGNWGSYVPIKWVLPPKQSSTKWSQYKEQ